MRHAGRRLRVALLALPLVAVTGCGKQQSTLAPQSDQSRQIMHLWWGMLAAAGVVFFGAVGMLALGWLRRNKPGWPFIGQNDGFSMGLVVGFGIVIPVFALVTLFFIANTGVLRTTAAPAKSATRMTIDVIGHQWFWEVRYPGTSAVTANEIHIPVRTRVNVVATTADVIHSFWVPELNRKIDMIPGQRNRILLDADRPGVYRGQCSEFCGLQHAHMALLVIVDSRQRFHYWLANQARPAVSAMTPSEQDGRQAFF